jgi:hypothetical protein
VLQGLLVLDSPDRSLHRDDFPIVAPGFEVEIECSQFLVGFNRSIGYGTDRLIRD